MSGTNSPRSLDLILDQCFTLLAAGAKSRKSAFHTPAVASIDCSGSPTQRIMVLRHVDREQNMLRFHTDSRSPKCTQVEADQRVCVLGYDPELAVQLRLQGVARVHRDSIVSDTAWRQSTAFARRCYMAEAAPGSPVGHAASGLPNWVEGQQPTDEQLAPARDNFAVIMVQINRIDWLHLANSGHRRAIFDRNGNRWHGTWCVP